MATDHLMCVQFAPGILRLWQEGLYSGLINDLNEKWGVMDACCVRDAEERFYTGLPVFPIIFNHRGVVQQEEHPPDTRKVNGATPFTSTIRW